MHMIKQKICHFCARWVCGYLFTRIKRCVVGMSKALSGKPSALHDCDVRFGSRDTSFFFSGLLFGSQIKKTHFKRREVKKILYKFGCSFDLYNCVKKKKKTTTKQKNNRNGGNIKCHQMILFLWICVAGISCEWLRHKPIHFYCGPFVCIGQMWSKWQPK